MQQTFESVLAHNEGRIRYITSRYSKAGEFDDMYQEILLQLWRSYTSFAGRSSINTWVYKVALNTASSFVKDAVKHKEIKQSAVQIAEHKPATEEMSCQEDLLTRFMDQLSDIDSGLLMMYLDGLSSSDMAEVLGISDNAVRSRIKRIKLEFEQNFVGDE